MQADPNDTDALSLPLSVQFHTSKTSSQMNVNPSKPLIEQFKFEKSELERHREGPGLRSDGTGLRRPSTSSDDPEEAPEAGAGAHGRGQGRSDKRAGAAGASRDGAEGMRASGSGDGVRSVLCRRRRSGGRGKASRRFEVRGQNQSTGANGGS
uniref:Uncharacterized protein n=1 Tax=Corethron hystrix TaxID=216773 RepID=A0A7S1FVR1_9STRA|mmetsp:Transcript_3234/g.5963  ORF Transcript_3234/g.5963 Transcript_3234/m.5963 type:complete len:153 (+) Transcript_3234:88-546(+)